jgi:hypothetical protein
MTIRLWLGIITFLAGALLLARTSARPAAGAARRHLALGLGALGLATLASTQPGPWWSVSAISFSIVAIVLLALVLRASLRR